jgi:hypothetical protein
VVPASYWRSALVRTGDPREHSGFVARCRSRGWGALGHCVHGVHGAVGAARDDESGDVVWHSDDRDREY